MGRVGLKLGWGVLLGINGWGERQAGERLGNGLGRHWGAFLFWECMSTRAWGVQGVLSTSAFWPDNVLCIPWDKRFCSVLDQGSSSSSFISTSIVGLQTKLVISFVPGFSSDKWGNDYTLPPKWLWWLETKHAKKKKKIGHGLKSQLPRTLFITNLLESFIWFRRSEEQILLTLTGTDLENLGAELDTYIPHTPLNHKATHRWSVIWKVCWAGWKPATPMLRTHRTQHDSVNEGPPTKLRTDNR